MTIPIPTPTLIRSETLVPETMLRWRHVWSVAYSGIDTLDTPDTSNSPRLTERWELQVRGVKVLRGCCCRV